MVEPHSPQINPKEMLSLFINGEYDRLSEKFISVLEHFENVTYFELAANAQYFINVFVENFLYLFTQPEYILSDHYTLRFIQLNPTISNLVAISSFKTTDAHLEILKAQSCNFIKFLALYSARNTIKIERKLLFDANPHFACVWYSYFYELYKTALVNKEAYQNMRDHLLYKDERLNTFYNISDVYFGATYIDGNRDREIKQKINQSVKNSLFCTTANIKNKPHPKKIAIITCLWFPQHSVYRTLSEYINSLKDDYELTLVHIGDVTSNIKTDSFKTVKYISYKNGTLDIEPIRENDFTVVYYPDIGMSSESIILSNLRIAPIQICGTGHPVSTFGSEIDYFISGADVEVGEVAEDKYSERLVLLPGFGAIHNQLHYQIKNIQKSRSDFIINCSWFSHKVNYPMLCILREIIKESKKKVFFRFFAGGIESLGRKNGFIPFVKDLENVLGTEYFEVIPAKPYDEYMALMEEADLCLESYHFGGSNIVADSLYLKKLIVTLEGNRWYNRIGSQMVRSLGLKELITTNPKDYIRLILRLIQDDEYRFKVQQKLQKADLSKTVFNAESKKYFKKAINLLIANHEQLKLEDSRKPIVISRSSETIH